MPVCYRSDNHDKIYRRTRIDFAVINCGEVVVPDADV